MFATFAARIRTLFGALPGRTMRNQLDLMELKRVIAVPETRALFIQSVMKGLGHDMHSLAAEIRKRGQHITWQTVRNRCDPHYSGTPQRRYLGPLAELIQLA